MLLVLIGSVSFLVCCCGAFEQSQNSSVVGFSQSASLSQLVQNATSLSVSNPETFVYLPKKEYMIGEPIEISGLTTLPAGTHLYIEISRDWHQKAVPEGKAIGWEEDVIVQDTINGLNKNFFLNVNSTILLPGKYEITVANLDARSEDVVIVNKTSLTLIDPHQTTQSAYPISFTISLVIIATGLVLLRKKRKNKISQ
jgi:hypothetical protein